MIIRADARHIPLVDGCVQSVVTSPPYWALRDYGHGEQIGLEPTPELYVASILQVFREVRRVLKADGTVWLNLGDSYAGSGKGPSNDGSKQRTNVGSLIPGTLNPAQFSGGQAPTEWIPVPQGLKPKDLCGIPWRVAFALQADGWYLRNDVIWSKPNPMPESVTDRLTKAHEYVFLLAKSERYYFDSDAIAEPVSASMLAEVEQGYDGLGLKDYAAAGVQNPSSVKARIIAGARRKTASIPGQALQPNLTTHSGGIGSHCLTRNKRSVWTVNTQPYSGAHFATMPEALVEPCILAGCPAGGLVFDPFLGSGTVGVVAERFGRRWVGADLSYQPLSKKRTAQRGIRFDQPVSADAVRLSVDEAIVPLRA